MSQNIDYSKGIYDARQLGAGRMLILGVQHMFAMFGATVLVPLLTGLSVSTTLLRYRYDLPNDSGIPIKDRKSVV